MSSNQSQLYDPHLTAVLNAYARWRHFEQGPAQGTATPRNLPRYDQHAHLSISLSPPMAFLMSCPCIDAQKLPEDERNCPICTEPYHPLSDRGRDNHKVKFAQRLPCDHHLCDKCMYQWLEPFGASNNNTCPFDRRVLFPKLPPPFNTEGIQQRVDLLDWLTATQGRQFQGADRHLIAKLKATLVERRLGEAIEELELEGLRAENLILESKLGKMVGEVGAAAHPTAWLKNLKHRLSTIATIADSLKGHTRLAPSAHALEEDEELSELRERLQCLADKLARY